MGEALTRRQQAILDHLRETRHQQSHPPTLDELCSALGLRSRGSMHKHVQALVEAGYVEPLSGKQRGVRLREPDAPHVDALPLLGRIAAGRPISLEEAWQAAEAAGLGKDLQALPMGLQTLVPAGGSNLSGGQRQRLAIARALAGQPRLLLLDEPTSALDPERVKEVLDAMRQLARAGMTMVVVTHELGFAREVADRVMFMDQGQVVETSDPASFFTNAREERSRRFLSQMV